MGHLVDPARCNLWHKLPLDKDIRRASPFSLVIAADRVRPGQQFGHAAVVQRAAPAARLEDRGRRGAGRHQLMQPPGRRLRPAAQLRREGDVAPALRLDMEDGPGRDGADRAEGDQRHSREPGRLMSQEPMDPVRLGPPGAMYPVPLSLFLTASQADTENGWLILSWTKQSSMHPPAVPVTRFRFPGN
jgi:hypothetical protein